MLDEFHSNTMDVYIYYIYEYTQSFQLSTANDSFQLVIDILINIRKYFDND